MKNTPMRSIFATARSIKRIALVTITLLNGAVIRWTDDEQDAEYAARRWTAGPGLMVRGFKSSVGLAAAEGTIELYPRDGDMLGDMTLRAALMLGVFDGAEVLISYGYRRLEVAPPALDGGMDRHIGKVGAIKPGWPWRISVRSPLVGLDQPFPSRVYSPRCTFTLFDGDCQRATAGAVRTGTPSEIDPSSMWIKSAGIADLPANKLRGGRLLFTGGANAGLSLRIREHPVANHVAFSEPWPRTITTADTFVAFFGCAHDLTTCVGAFGNRIHFGGMPFVPAPETTT